MLPPVYGELRRLAAARLFGAGLAVNLIMGLLPVPDIFQTIGSAVRNLGLMLMGSAILFTPTATLVISPKEDSA